MKQDKKPKRFKKLLDKRPERLKRTKRAPEPEVREQVPRITNETVAAHREEVLGSARKYIYPLQHSKHRIVLISGTLFVVALVAFMTYAVLALYKFQSSSTFLYRVTQVIPFPVARAGDRFVAYENYLFELRHYTYYYENQLDTDFSDPRNEPQLADFRRRALDKVISDAYVSELAKQQNISVSNQEINDQITIGAATKKCLKTCSKIIGVGQLMILSVLCTASSLRKKLRQPLIPMLASVQKVRWQISRVGQISQPLPRSILMTTKPKTMAGRSP